MNIYKKVFDGKNIGEILYDEPMKNHTTFKIGGSCDVMIFPKNEEQIIKCHSINKTKSICLQNYRQWIESVS